MIDDERVPGWLNFILLIVFYSVVFYGMILFWDLAERFLGETAVRVIVLFAGAYLAKRKFYWSDGKWIRRFF